MTDIEIYVHVLLKSSVAGQIWLVRTCWSVINGRWEADGLMSGLETGQGKGGGVFEVRRKGDSEQEKKRKKGLCLRNVN